MSDIKEILNAVYDGTVSVDEAYLMLRQKPFSDLGYAKPDHHRGIRQGQGEVIYGEGKTADEIIGITKSLLKNGQDRVLITRLSADKAKAIERELDITYHNRARLGVAGTMPETRIGNIVIATGGTSDIPVAEEAAVTAEFFANNVTRLYDVGVSGIHRLLSSTDTIMSANAIVAVAGMEGALASVIGGMADCPVIAVPTSVGYGAAFGGVTALLAMLNSCASGVSVVNIDNGFGAGYLAGIINKATEK